MTIELAPAFEITTERSHLMRERGHAAVSLPDHLVDTLLAKLAESIRPGRPAPTKPELAALVHDCSVIAHEKTGLPFTARSCATAAVCTCGHPFGEHVGRHGCLDCACMARRPRTIEQARAGEAR